MGFFDWFRERKATAEVKTLLNKRIAQLIEMQQDEPDEWQKLVERRLDAPLKQFAELREASSDPNQTVVVNTRNEGVGWEILGSAYKGHVGQDQQVMIAQARRFFRFDPNAQASIYGIVEYLMGRGVTITPKANTPQHWKLWRNFWTDPGNKMGIRQFEIVKRWARDGEVLLRIFKKNAAGDATPTIQVRFLDPIDLRRGANEANDQTDKTSQGIVFDPDDAEKPLKYYFRKRNNPAEEDVIDASEVLHIKFPTADMDQSRGESAMQAIMDLFTHYKQWLRNRIILNKLRTAIFAVREIDVQSGASVSSLSQSIPSSGRQSDNENKKQNIRPGTLYTPPPGVKMRMESANINASDVKEDGRNMILGMAAGMGEPEYLYGDASNANYSSTMMAESPFVKRIHYYQSYLEETLWKPLYRAVIQAAVDAGKMKAPVEEDIFADPKSGTELNEAAKPDDEGTDDAGAPVGGGAGKKPAKKGAPADDESDDKRPDGQSMSESETEIFFGCDVEWPEIIHRDPVEQTNALVLARNEGWVSDKTCSEKLGFEYPEEVRKQQQIEEEAEDIGNPLLARVQGQMKADAEAAAALQQQNQIEADAAKGGENEDEGGKGAKGAGGE